jgi:hypothetical protein
MIAAWLTMGHVRSRRGRARPLFPPLLEALASRTLYLRSERGSAQQAGEAPAAPETAGSESPKDRLRTGGGRFKLKLNGRTSCADHISDECTLGSVVLTKTA